MTKPIENQDQYLAACISPSSFWPVDFIVPESAWLEHAPFAFWLTEALRPRCFVELGTHGGFSYFAFCQAVQRLAMESKCYAVDTWLGDEHAGQYGDEVFTAVKKYNTGRYSAFSDLIRSTFDEACAYFADGTIDLLHIDGRHFYEDVKHDFETWQPKLSERAVVLFHDTNVREMDFGVFKFWNELRLSYPSFEFLHGHGLGVLGIGKKLPESLSALFAASESAVGAVSLRALYARLGSAIEIESKNIVQQELLSKQKRELEEISGQLVQARGAAGENLVLKQRLNSRAEENRKLKETSREREAQLASRIEKEAQLASRIEKMEYVLSVRDSEILAYKDSTSWKLTAPYRLIGRQIRRALAKSGKAESEASDLHSLDRLLLAELPQGLRLTSEEEVKDRNDYAEWVRRYATLDDIKRARIKSHISKLPANPTISIVMPVYNPNLVWLREAIGSVRNQIYPKWQLCIADDHSLDPEVREELAGYQELDGRISVAFREENGHISAASNTALGLATGDWIALLDQDDLLPEDALYHVVAAISKRPDAGLLYSDEDKTDETGQRFSPYFKSDWNPDLFLSHNMFSHLGVYRADIVKKVGGFRQGYEGSQDYDLALRCVEQLKPDQIVHVPKVLYHWRSHAESTAQAGSNKNYALLAGQRVLDEHFARSGIEATAELLDFGMYRAKYKLPEPLPLVSLIIPTRNGFSFLQRCVDSILEKTDYGNYEVIVVDNDSDDLQALNYLTKITQDPRVRILRDDQPFNYSAINNNAVREARGEYVGLINNDVEVISHDWLNEMVSIATQPGVGAVGACLWYPNDTLQHGGTILGLGGVANHSHLGLPRGEHGYFGRGQLIQTFSAVTAACLIVKKKIYQQVGGLDEENLKIAFNDVDFCLRVREAGYRNVWTPYAELYHHESVSRGSENTPEKLSRFIGEVQYMQRRWDTEIQYDPAYNPNLTLDRMDFSLAWPPRI